MMVFRPITHLWKNSLPLLSVFICFYIHMMFNFLQWIILGLTDFTHSYLWPVPLMEKDVTRIGMVNMSQRQKPHWDENVSPRPSIGLHWTTRRYVYPSKAPDFTPICFFRESSEWKFLFFLDFFLHFLYVIVLYSVVDVNCILFSCVGHVLDPDV